MRNIYFYKTADGKCPVREFLDGLPELAVAKIYKVLGIIKNLEVVPKKYFKHLQGTDFYECRITHSGDDYRLLGFFFMMELSLF